ncbi:MAG: hypothetical protein LBS59_06740 [Puniceicoccales bacterium]|jgi:hypothetical protein|nr:hypothetical protein [Puniceicoccales bacterium]
MANHIKESRKAKAAKNSAEKPAAMDVELGVKLGANQKRIPPEIQKDSRHENRREKYLAQSREELSLHKLGDFIRPVDACNADADLIPYRLLKHGDNK